MAKKYDPNKRLRRVCRNPLKLIIGYEDGYNRYILIDETKTFGRVLDMNVSTIYDTKYLAAIFKFNPKWKKYTGSQEELREMLLKIKYIWDTPSLEKKSNAPREFNIYDY